MRTTAALALLCGLAAAEASAQSDLAVCQYLTRHRPAPDVEYTPGVDVRGNAVAPADLPGSHSAAPMESFDIPVTLDFARRMGVAVPSGGLPGRTQVGSLAVRGNRVLFNGQPLGAANEAELVALCRSAR